MSKTVSLLERTQQLQKLQASLPEMFRSAATEATKRAVQVTTDATPPKAGTGRGAYIGSNTLSGELKAHWATDSSVNAEQSGNRYKTTLANNMEYASYVNNGHRMDRHFVPGLYVNPHSGLLEYDPAANTGIVVGTKTAYVKGEFMADKGIKEYQKTIRDILDKKIAEAMKK